MWVQHMSVAESVIHFKRNGLHASEMLKCIEYMVVQDVVIAPPGF